MELDVKKLPFDLEIVRKIKDPSKLFEVFPVLDKYDAFRNDCLIPVPRAFELIVLLYSIGTPLILNREQAKATAAEYFGYKVIDGVIKDPIIQDLLIEGKDEGFNYMVVSYCRMQKNSKWSKLVAWWDIYYSNIALLRSSVGETKEKQKDIITVIDKLEKDIEAMVPEFLNNDIGEGVRRALYEELETASLGIRPEEIATKLEDGEDPLPDTHPYGKDYTFETYGDRTKINPLSND
jgi:hypothetical protein